MRLIDNELLETSKLKQDLESMDTSSYLSVIDLVIQFPVLIQSMIDYHRDLYQEGSIHQEFYELFTKKIALACSNPVSAMEILIDPEKSKNVKSIIAVMDQSTVSECFNESLIINLGIEINSLPILPIKESQKELSLNFIKEILTSGLTRNDPSYINNLEITRNYMRSLSLMTSAGRNLLLEDDEVNEIFGGIFYQIREAILKNQLLIAEDLLMILTSSLNSKEISFRLSNFFDYVNQEYHKDIFTLDIINKFQQWAPRTIARNDPVFTIKQILGDQLFRKFLKWPETYEKKEILFSTKEATPSSNIFSRFFRYI